LQGRDHAANTEALLYQIRSLGPRTYETVVARLLFAGTVVTR